MMSQSLPSMQENSADFNFYFISGSNTPKLCFGSSGPEMKDRNCWSEGKNSRNTSELCSGGSRIFRQFLYSL